MTRDLLALADWLQACGVRHLAMESTGVYGKPVGNILEGKFEILWVNAQHIKAVPGRKTDQNDAEWIADLLPHGLVGSSFVPPTPLRELRDLTRYGVSLVQECNRIANRIQKVLEDGHIKLAWVATEALGALGRAMLKAMREGEENVEKLAEMSRGLLRNKIPELQRALEGRLRSHPRFLLKELREHWEFVESKIAQLEGEIGEPLGPFEEKVERLCTIPGVEGVTASGLMAEMGVNREQFADAEHWASWAGLCPGSHESAGKGKSGKTRKGSAWLRRCLCPAAWAVSTQKNNYLSALYRRLAARRGTKRAIIALAHTLLQIAYYILREGKYYRELGADYFDQLHASRVKRYLVKRLERLGFQVSLVPAAQPE